MGKRAREVEPDIYFEEVDALCSRLEAQGDSALVSDCRRVMEHWDLDSVYETPEYARVYALVVMYRTLGLPLFDRTRGS